MKLTGKIKIKRMNQGKVLRNGYPMENSGRMSQKWKNVTRKIRKMGAVWRMDK